MRTPATRAADPSAGPFNIDFSERDLSRNSGKSLN